MRVVWVKSSIKDKRRREKQTKSKEKNLMKEIENQQKPNQPVVQPPSLPPVATIIASLLFEINSNVKTLAIFPFFLFFYPSFYFILILYFFNGFKMCYHHFTYTCMWKKFILENF